ncbi:hypothetical protein FRC03_005735 [Tulasnella sp. 419]|nr:hypothetical protein FRC03_005735 [Tulasnella sp. 419]
MAFIDILSDDILSEVFVIANAAFLANPGQWSKPALRLPEILSHVSRRWRYVTTGNATLWTDIFVYTIRALPSVELWLSRSKGAPLSITLHPLLREIFEYPIPDADIMALADLLIPHLSHTRKLIILGPGQENEDIFEPNNFASSLIAKFAAALGCSSRTSSIEQLVYVDDKRFSLPIELSSPSYTSLFSSTRDLSMFGNAFEWDWSVRKLTRLRLRQLHGQYAPSITQLRDMLHHSSLLNELDIDWITFRENEGTDDVESSTKELQLLQLKCLSIGVVYNGTLHRLLQSLRAPVLSTISVTITIPSTAAALRTLDAMTSIVACSPITDFTLKFSFTRFERGTQSVMERLASLLHANQSVKRFTLESGYAAFSDQVLEHLLYMREIECLVIRRSRFSVVALQYLLQEMLQIRQTKLPRLELLSNRGISFQESRVSGVQELEGLMRDQVEEVVCKWSKEEQGRNQVLPFSL